MYAFSARNSGNGTPRPSKSTNFIHTVPAALDEMRADQARQFARIEQLLRQFGIGDQAPISLSSAPVPPASRPHSFASAVGSASAKAPARPAHQLHAAPSSVPVARDVAAEIDRVSKWASAHAEHGGWSQSARQAVVEACVLAVRRGASCDDVARRLLKRYCLFDVCTKDECQRCRAGRSASDCPRRH